MPRKIIHLTGLRFGKRIVLRRAGEDAHGNSKWICRCDCGREDEVISPSLRRGAANMCVDCRDSETHGGVSRRKLKLSEIESMIESGVSVAQIAKDAKVSRTQIYARLRQKAKAASI